MAVARIEAETPRGVETEEFETVSQAWVRVQSHDHPRVDTRSITLFVPEEWVEDLENRRGMARNGFGDWKPIRKPLTIRAI